MRSMPEIVEWDVPQPKEWLETEGGICVRMIELEKVCYMVPQHAHEHGHTTLVARGAVSLWVEGEYQGDYAAPSLKYVAANKHHVYQALVDNTVLACVSKQE